ncbi:uncharacterized protein M421DRAFT_170072 [Didymella exigua CBS 183.55]|uniref:Uncharacterized protein n=1 Tax=Didymella exigua CBS 183.55 TaxID=1150837 RepID=A0A6A5RKB9_9PLEO|nr:uncharacterized protein M421DRAFT_170072 [Didymella exigua CBS 183.55]KAF1927558.1 hypothetical protein M421DRAFT_170072 [Didymella exigua CBS 183.55]
MRPDSIWSLVIGSICMPWSMCMYYTWKHLHSILIHFNAARAPACKWPFALPLAEPRCPFWLAIASCEVGQASQRGSGNPAKCLESTQVPRPTRQRAYQYQACHGFCSWQITCRRMGCRAYRGYLWWYYRDVGHDVWAADFVKDHSKSLLFKQ